MAEQVGIGAEVFGDRIGRGDARGGRQVAAALLERASQRGAGGDTVVGRSGIQIASSAMPMRAKRP